MLYNSATISVFCKLICKIENEIETNICQCILTFFFSTSNLHIVCKLHPNDNRLAIEHRGQLQSHIQLDYQATKSKFIQCQHHATVTKYGFDTYN